MKIEITTKIKDYFLSPLFAPIAGLLVYSIFLNIAYIFLPHHIPQISREGELIDILTYSSYGILFIIFAVFFNDYKDKKLDYFSCIFLTLCALLREMGAQKWLTSTDSTAIKIKFFTNPNNPLSEKIVSALIILLVLTAAIYLIKKYFLHLFKGVLKMDTISWTFGTLVFFGLFSKFIDRLPSNFRKSHDEGLSQLIIDNLSILEEGGEIFIPTMAIILLVQYHFIDKNKNI